MKKQKFIRFSDYYREMKKQVSMDNREKSIEMIDTMLISLGKATMNNVKVIEGVDIDLWKNRVWNTLESMGELPLYNEESSESTLY